MTVRNRYCSPIWKEEDGLFIPEDWTQIQFSSSVQRTIRTLQEHIITKDVPVFVRGSLIEELNPHPKSDLDILYIAPQTSPLVFHPNIRSEFSRTLDINPYHPDALEPRRYLVPLIHIRSMQISGPKFARTSIEISDTFAEDLWEQYRVESMSSNLRKTGIERVMKLKHLFRALGLLSLMDGDGFTRDINACLEWLHKKNSKLTEYGQQLWMERTSSHPLYIAPIRDWISQQWANS